MSLKGLGFSRAGAMVRAVGKSGGSGLMLYSSSGLARIALATISVAAAALNPAAAMAKGSAEACLNTRFLEDFSAPDTHTVYARVGVNEIWRLDLMQNCLELPYRLNIGIEGPPGDPWICKPVEATIVNHGSAIPHRCKAIGLHRLSADEIAALPPKDRP